MFSGMTSVFVIYAVGGGGGGGVGVSADFLVGNSMLLGARAGLDDVRGSSEIDGNCEMCTVNPVNNQR